MQSITKSIVVWMIAFAAILGLMTVLTSSSVFADCSDPTSIQSGVDCVGENIQNKSSLEDVVQNVINTMLFLIGIISVIMLIVGGIRYVISGGNQSQVEGARNTILYAIVGLVVAFVAWGIVNFVIGALTES